MISEVGAFGFGDVKIPKTFYPLRAQHNIYNWRSEYYIFFCPYLLIMAAYSLIKPTIILLSGQSFEQLILTLGLIALVVVFGLTAFIFIRIFLHWWQDKLEIGRAHV